jgi:hypothetical protein
MDGEHFMENIFYAAFMMFEVKHIFPTPWKLHIYNFRNQLQKIFIFSKIFIMFAFNHGLGERRE